MTSSCSLRRACIRSAMGRNRSAGHHPLGVFEQPAARGDVDGRLLLVARDHPHLHARLEQSGDGLRDAVLQLVFDGGDANQLEVLLDLVLQLRHLLLAAVQQAADLLEAVVPLAVDPDGDHLGAQAERAQPLLGKQAQVPVGVGQRLGLLPRAEPLQDGVVCALAEQPDGAVGAPGHHAHPLALARKLDHIEQIKLDGHALN
eukprot:scaffold10950_cov29-Prasinocladus_malaysianus.AAC.1